MKRIEKVLSSGKIKILSIIFTCITIVCLSTIMILSMTYTKNDSSGGDVYVKTEAHYNSLNSIDDKYFIYTTYTANDAPDGSKVAGKWITGIDIDQINLDYNTGYVDYLTNHPSLVIPEGVVGVDFSTLGIDSVNTAMGSSSIFANAVSYIEKVVIPKSVSYIASASFYNFANLGYLETPFIGTSRGSSARGINFVKDDIAGYGNNPTSDSFGSMFSQAKLDPSNNILNNPVNAVTEWDANLTPVPKTIKWCEIKEGNDSDSSNSGFSSPAFYYQIPSEIDFLIITDETSLGNYALAQSTARNVKITQKDNGDVFRFGNYCFAESGIVGTSDGQGNTTLGSPGLETIELNLKGNFEFKNGTFDKCETLKSLIVPYGCSNIPEAFLYQAISLTHVYLPTTIQRIGKGAFKNCELLERIVVYKNDKDNKPTGNYDDDVANGIISSNAYKFNLPSGLKEIGIDAFANCKKIETIYVPESVEKIGFNAFGGCQLVKEAILPFVGNHAGDCDSSCTKTSTKDEDNKDYHHLFGWIFGTTSKGSGTFYDAPQQYTSGGTKTFTIPVNLSSVIITKETKLGTGCFNNIQSLTSISINDDVEANIAIGCFDGCSKLNTISIPYLVGNHLGCLFGADNNPGDGWQKTINDYKVPTSLQTVKVTNMPIASGALFYNCSNIKNVEFGKKTECFGNGIFYNNQQLTSLTIPFVGRHRGYCDYYTSKDYCGYIGWVSSNHRNTLLWLFSSTDHSATYHIDYYYYEAYIPNTLKNITITDDTYLTSTGLRYFSSLESVVIDCVPGYIDSGFVGSCTSLISIQVPYIGCNTNINGDSASKHTFGWIFGGGSSNLCYSANGWAIPKTLKTVTVGTSNSNLTKSNKVFDNAFNGCKNITTIDFRNAEIVALGVNAFKDCTNLEMVIYPNAKYEHVSNYAFYNCKKLRTLEKNGNLNGFIPSTVKTIGDYAFAGTSVGYVDDNAYRNNILNLSKYKSLGAYAFSDCLQLTTVTVPENVSIGEGLFAGCSYLETCILPNNKTEANVSKYMFKDCISLKEIDLNGIKKIPDGILQGCINLPFENVTLNQSISYIGAYAFKDCKSFTNFVFPVVDGALTIDKGAFQGCIGLENMTIPAETKVINPNGWDGCNENFFFWVYYPEEQWPQTWVDNWNCFYPVYVLGDLSQDIFTYIYDTEEKGYYITGITEKAYESGLSGLIRIPASHNGVAVIGIDENRLSNEDEAAGARSITTQTGITQIILPKGITKIVKYTKDEKNKALYGKFPFETGNRIDIYTEYTRAEIKKIYDASYALFEQEYQDWVNSNIANEQEKAEAKRSIFRKLKGWKPFEKDSDGYYRKSGDLDEWDERNWTSGGFLYYFDEWQYGSSNTTTASITPYLRVDAIRFILDENELNSASYTGEQVIVSVVDAILPGEIFENPSLGVETELLHLGQENMEIFNFQYRDNLNVGTAKIDVTVINDALNIYNMNLQGPLQNFPLRLTGKGVIEYKIMPVQLMVIATANDGLYYTHEYNNEYWTYDNWQQDQIIGIEGYNGLKLTGTLRTNGKTVNFYSGNDLVWQGGYSLTINGIDVKKNFEIIISFFVEIIPLEVEIVYTTEKEKVDGFYQLAPLWDTQDLNYPIYSYRYIGAGITPYAVAKKFGTDEYIDYCKVTVEHVNNQGTLPYSAARDSYQVFAYLNDNTNFKLYKNVNGVKTTPDNFSRSSTVSYICIIAYYRISKGLITINIDLTGNKAYKIGINEDAWVITWGVVESGNNSFTYNGYNEYITGLGPNSIFIGRIATSSDLEAVYSFKTASGDSETSFGITSITGGNHKLSWQPGIYYSDNSNGVQINFTSQSSTPFLIYNPQLKIADESSYYDIKIDINVEIVYETFNHSFYIGPNDNNYEAIKEPLYNVTNQFEIVEKEVENVGGLIETRPYYYTQYEVDGQEYRFSIEDILLLNKYLNTNDWNKLNYVKTYLSGNGTTLNENDVTFKELGQHVFTVILNARHYKEAKFDIWIEAVKSNVKISSLDKYYDKLPVDYAYITDPTRITKIGNDQKSTIKITYYDSTGTIELKDPPVNAGKYKVHITIDEGEYFNAFDKVIDFEIKKRIITVDINGQISFDNSKYTIDLSSRNDLDVDDPKQGPNGGLLLYDKITGVLETSDLIPEIYYPDNQINGYYFNWKHTWDITYTIDNSSVKENYEIKLDGKFEIKPLEFEYSVTDSMLGTHYTKVNTNSLNSGISTAAVTKPIPSDGVIDWELEIDYDGLFHQTKINVTYPNAGNIAPNVSAEYEIWFSDSPLSEYSNAWVNTATPYTTPGEYFTYFMIKADYFKTIIGKAKLIIVGKEIKYMDPAWDDDGDGDTTNDDNDDNRWTIYYTGDLQTYSIKVMDPSDNSEVVWYNVNGTGWTTQEPAFKDIGTYTVDYKIVAPNYETVEHTITVDIREPKESIPDSAINYQFYNGVYDGEFHSATANFDATWLSNQASGFTCDILYSSDGGITWIHSNQCKDIGKYPLQIKFVAKGYKDKIVKGENIITGKKLYLVPVPKTYTFDNKYHNIGLEVSTEGIALGYSLDYDADSNTYTLKWTEDGKQMSSDLTLYYTTNIADKYNDTNWLSGDGYKDAGLYAIFMKVTADYFEPLIVTDYDTGQKGYETLRIEFLANPTIKAKSPQIFEYRKAALTVDDIELETPADGIRTAYWYSATKDINGNYSYDNPKVRINPPQELGVYFVVIKIAASKNTGSASTEGLNPLDHNLSDDKTVELIFVEIVPKELEIIVDSPQYYDGTIKDPNPRVDTGTTDVLNLSYRVQGSKDPIEVGKYVFDVSIATSNPNYVLKVNTFDFEIIKRSVLFKIDEEAEFDANRTKWNYKKSENYDDSQQAPGDDRWYKLGNLSGTYNDKEYSGLANNHMILIEFETAFGNKATYVYTTLNSNYYSNKINITGPNYNGSIKPIIVEKDGSGNIVFDINGNPVDVSDFYDIDIDIVVSLVNPKFDLDKLTIKNEYIYDGYTHQVIINVPTEYSNGVYIEYYYEDTGRWSTVAPKQTLVGEYEVKFRISASGFETTEGTTNFIINQAELNIKIGDLYKKSDLAMTKHEKYDATAHINKYSLLNINPNSDTKADHIRYYDSSIYTEKQIKALYKKYQTQSDFELDDMYKAGLGQIVDAGKYWCVVFYEEDPLRWKTAYAYEEIELKPRDIQIDMTNANYTNIIRTYNGDPIEIFLTYAIIDMNQYGDDGLLNTHEIILGTNNSKLKTYYVQTNSPNAGVYNLATDFEFGYIEIKEKASSKYIKMSNYHPVISGNFTVEILKKYLEQHEFDIIYDELFNKQYNEYEKEYDGKVHTPDYFNDEENDIYGYISATDGKLVMTFYEFSSYTSDGPLLSGEQKDVGKYHVIFEVLEGTNYYSSEASSRALKADGTPYLCDENGVAYRFLEYYVTCVPKEVEVIWNNIEQKFNGESLKPNPEFIDNETDPENPIKVQLKTLFYDNGTYSFIDTEVYNAGSYLVKAEFDTSKPSGIAYSKNYTFKSSTVTNYFVINKLTLYIQIGDGDGKNDIEYYGYGWTSDVKLVDTPNYPEFIDNDDPDAKNFMSIMNVTSVVGFEPTISTSENEPSLYKGKTGFVVDAVVTISTVNGNIDVTKSIEFDFIGSVRLYSNELKYDLISEVTKEYRETDDASGFAGYTFADLEVLKVINPKTFEYTDLKNYKINGSDASLSDGMSQVGRYEITCDLSCEGYSPERLTIILNIVEKESYIILGTNLNKQYDGVAVDGKGLVTKEQSGFNGELSDLVYEYYKVEDNGTETLLSSAPITVGNYKMYITSAKDNDPTYQKNYTRLEYSTKFTISKRTIDLVYDLDYQLSNDSLLGIEWKSGEMSATSADTNNQLISSNLLKYQFNKIQLTRGEFYAKKLFNLSDNYSLQKFYADNGQEFGFAWVIYETDAQGNIKTEQITYTDNSGQTIIDYVKVDVSENYNINLSFKLNVHYPYLPVEVKGADVDYDGAAHSGTVTFKDNKIHDATWYENNTIQYYSETPIDINDPQGINNITLLSKTEPGTYRIYYLIVIDKNSPNVNGELYEEYTGYFIININKLEVEIVITDPTKDYDGKAAGTKTPSYQYLTNNNNDLRYLPDFDITNPLNYNKIYMIEKSDIEITYYYGETKIDALDGCIEAGTYQYVMKFPATEYYKETYITRTYFYINRIKIYIANDNQTNTPNGTVMEGYKEVYNSMAKTFEFKADLDNRVQIVQQNGCYKIYQIVNNAETPITDKLISTKFVTDKNEIGLYKGNDGTLTMFGYEFSVYDTITGKDITNNYTIDYTKMTIEITPAQIVYTKNKASYIYDTLYHGYDLFITTPLRSDVTIRYWYEDEKVWKLEEPVQNTVGQYQVKVELSAENYETVYDTLDLEITQAPTYIYYVTAQGKTYDGAEVAIPTEIRTNRKEEWSITGLIYKYYEWDETLNNGAGGWKPDPMYTQQLDQNGKIIYTGERPIDVGKYKIFIEIPATHNYSKATYESEFYISKLSTTISWGVTNFEYNGNTQIPTGDVVLTAADKKENITIKLIITAVPNGYPNDINCISAGNYEAKAVIDYGSSHAKAKNYQLDPSTATLPYSILKRHITISFSKINLYDNYPNHDYLIKYPGAMTPTTDLEFSVTNLVNGHIITDYLKLNYNSTIKEYRTKNDFDWYSVSTNSATGLYYPQIYDVNNNLVHENYIIDRYNLELVLTDIAGIPTYTLQGQTYPYDGDPHSFTFILDDPTKYDVYYQYTGPQGYIGTGNNFVPSTVFPSRDNNQPGIPSFTDVGRYSINIQIKDTNGNILITDTTFVEITPASPDLKPVDGFVLGKTYDGIPVVDPEMSYKDKDTKPVTLTYTYYSYNPNTGLYDIKLNAKPVNVGKYRLIVEYPGNTTNYNSQTYDQNNFIFEIKERKITIAIKPDKGTKLFDYLVWSAEMDDSDVEGSGIEGLAPNQTIQKETQILSLLSANVGTYYPNGTHRTLLSWNTTSQNPGQKCKIWDENGLEVQDNYVFEYTGEIVIKKRSFSYEFNPCIKNDDGQPGFTFVNIKGVYDESGNIVTNFYISNSNVKVYYYTDVLNKSDYTLNPIGINVVGRPVNVFADIVDLSGNIESLYGLVSFVYILDQPAGGDPDLTDGPDDMINDPTNIDLPDTKNKVYDGIVYKDPKYIGPDAQNRTITIKYYTLDYYNQVNGVLDPSKALTSAPRDSGDYVVVLTASQTTTLPEQTWMQAFRIKRRPVKVEWSNLLVKLPNGQSSLAQPDIAKANFKNVFGVTVNLYVTESPGYTNVGIWPATATFYTTTNDIDNVNYSNTLDMYGVLYSKNYILNNPATSFEITKDGGKNPKPNDAQGRTDITFDASKVYDTFKYDDPIFTGFESNVRIPIIKYYSWDYYDNNWPNLDPSQALSQAPTDVGGYVFEMTIPASTTDPTNYPQEVIYQYFEITPWEVNVKWDDLKFIYDGNAKIPTGTLVDDSGNILVDKNGNQLASYPTMSISPANGYTAVGTYNIVAVSNNNNYKIKNPLAQMQIIGVEVEEIELVQGQVYTYMDMIILATTDGNYYIYKDEWDSDATHSIVSDQGYVYHDSQTSALTYDTVFADLSKVFAVDSQGIIYEIDNTYQLSNANRQYKMILDNSKDAKDGYQVKISLTDPIQTMWKNAQDTTDKMIGTYDIKQLDLPNTDWDIVYKLDPKQYVYNKQPIEPYITITLKNKLDPTKQIVLVDQRTNQTTNDYRLEFKYNNQLSTLSQKALIYVIGTGNYNFKSDTKPDTSNVGNNLGGTNPNGNLPLEFEIVDNIQLLELIDDSAARWITAVIEPSNDSVDMKGLDLDSNGNPVIINHTSPKESDLYLGRIPHETSIDVVLKQFKNYDTKPEIFVVKRPSISIDNPADIDNDGYVTLDPSSLNFKTNKFANGYKVCLVEKDTSGRITKILDEVTGIVLGDLDNDGYISLSDLSEAKKFVSSGLSSADIKIYNHLAAIVDRTNAFYNLRTVSAIKNILSSSNANGISGPDNFNYFDNDWSRFIQSSS